MGKLTATFKSISGKQYELTIENSAITTGTLTLSGDPLHLKSPEYETKYPGLRSTELVMNILTDQDMMELYTTDPLDTVVILKEDNVEIFCGYMEPEQYDMPFRSGTINEMQVVAIDGLSALRNYQMPERKAQYMSHWRNEINTIFSHHGISPSPTWHDIVTYAVINNDVLMPQDLYEDGTDERFGTYGDLLDEIGKAYNLTIMMVGRNVYCFNCDELTDTATIGTVLNGTLSIVAPARKITASFDKRPDIEQPDIKDVSSPTTLQWANSPDVSRPRQKYEGKYCNYLTATYTSQKYWAKYETLPAHVANPIMCVNYADNLQDITTEAGTWMVGISAISSVMIGNQLVKRPIVYSAGTGNTPIKPVVSVTIEADVHINGPLSSSSGWNGVPVVWKATNKEPGGANSTIALLIGRTLDSDGAVVNAGTIYNPSSYSTDYYDNDTSNSAWQHCKYNFTFEGSDFQIVVRSPQASTASDGIGYRYAKNIKISVTSDSEMKHAMNASGASSAEDIDIDCKINTLYFKSHGYSTAKSAGDNRSTYVLMTNLASQYSKPRRKLTLLHMGEMSAMAKTTIDGKTYTLVGFDRDLKNEQQQSILLESRATN